MDWDLLLLLLWTVFCFRTGMQVGFYESRR